MIRPTTLMLGLLLPLRLANAQILPDPATSSPGGLAPRVQAPTQAEEPIIIGEPVRHQAPPKTTSTPVVRAQSVAGVFVTRMSDAAALDKLKTALAPELKKPFRTQIGDYQYTFSRAELGASIPFRALLRQARTGRAVPLKLEVDRVTLKAALRELDAQVRDDFDATALDVDACARVVEAALEANPPREREHMITRRVAKVVPAPEPAPTTPVVQTPSNGQPFGFLLAAFSTRYDASLRGRTTNLKMAASHINGTIVAPGAVFSTNAAIGPRNAASGWREAKMFVSGRVVSGTGAGICQAASTLYNCALLGNFSIIERHPHSMRVMYVPPSRDAALMWGSKDFKFRNTSGAPIKVQTWVAGGQFHARVWGQKPRTTPKIELVSLVTSRRGGTHSTAYKLVGGQKIRLSNDFYRPHP